MDVAAILSRRCCLWLAAIVGLIRCGVPFVWMGCELSKGREKDLKGGKRCNQIDLAIQVDLFISIHSWILPFFLKPFAGAATQ